MDVSPGFCGHCGRPLTPAAGPPGTAPGHDACRAARALEPPRYCPRCGRRMIVKVTPTGWSSRCSHHGHTTSPASS
jgi:NADH pyrophosphatase NudC (nudix superfamily)